MNSFLNFFVEFLALLLSLIGAAGMIGGIYFKIKDKNLISPVGAVLYILADLILILFGFTSFKYFSPLYGVLTISINIVNLVATVALLAAPFLTMKKILPSISLAVSFIVSVFVVVLRIIRYISNFAAYGGQLQFGSLIKFIFNQILFILPILLLLAIAAIIAFKPDFKLPSFVGFVPAAVNLIIVFLFSICSSVADMFQFFRFESLLYLIIDFGYMITESAAIAFVGILLMKAFVAKKAEAIEVESQPVEEVPTEE